MALESYENNMIRCTRCSYCKWVPHQVMSHTDYLSVCPSIEKYNFHAWSAGGRTIAALSLLKGRSEITDQFQDLVYQCQMCGGCDVSCKVERDLEPYEIMQELRFKCVEEGRINLIHSLIMDGLRKEDNMMQEKKENRGKWAEGIPVKNLSREPAEVLYHAGCRYSFDTALWPTVRKGLEILLRAGVDVGIIGAEEACCGVRSYEMGFLGELKKYAEHNADAWKTMKVKKIVTPCADCFQAFKVVYDKIGRKGDVEILHLTEFLDQLIDEKKIHFTNEIPLTATYHDPCHLGRLAEPWVHWEGKEIKVDGQMIVHDPPKKKRCGANGVFDAPRNILSAIPGVRLVEMHRIREYAWCCGAGGGVMEAYPEFSAWTAEKRLEEAVSVGADALVSACPWCKRNFMDALDETGDKIKIYDVIDLVHQAIG